MSEEIVQASYLARVLCPALELARTEHYRHAQLN